MNRSKRTDSSRVTRRDVLRGAAGLAAASAAPWTLAGCVAGPDAAGGGKPITNGRIRQSVVKWCFANHWADLDRMCEVAVSLGCQSIELSEPEDWPTLKKHGLTCAIAPNGMADPPFVKGFNNPVYRDEVIATTRKRIDACAEAGVKTVIGFTGYKWRDAEDPQSGEIPAEEGAEHCVEGLKLIAPYAEEKGVRIAIEILNTRADDHPMKGHPGYQGDHADYVVDIVERVGSPNVGVLFDIYHVQIMDGDVIRRIRQHKDHIFHVHTAGNPGRGELDGSQEIHFPGIMKALLAVGYDGFVGQEFIPTGDPLEGLREACRLCDV